MICFLYVDSPVCLEIYNFPFPFMRIRVQPPKIVRTRNMIFLILAWLTDVDFLLTSMWQWRPWCPTVPTWVRSRVADPDPHVFGPPGSGSTSQTNGSGSGSCSGSGSFYHHTKIVRKTLIITVLWLILPFLSLKNEVNVTSKSHKQ